jgi:hypothetical protein
MSSMLPSIYTPFFHNSSQVSNFSKGKKYTIGYIKQHYTNWKHLCLHPFSSFGLNWVSFPQTWPLDWRTQFNVNPKTLFVKIKIVSLIVPHMALLQQESIVITCWGLQHKKEISTNCDMSNYNFNVINTTINIWYCIL